MTSLFGDFKPFPSMLTTNQRNTMTTVKSAMRFDLCSPLNRLV